MGVACTHCGLEFDESAMIKDEDRFFCCNGCKGVYHLLKDENLDSFYDKKGDTKLHSVQNFEDSLERFDLEGFQNAFVTQKNGFKEVSLIIEGIHCVACIWLNEKILEQQSGIIEANINFTTHKAKIIWDDEQIKLSRIIELIRSIGYNAYAYDPKKSEDKIYKQRRDYFHKMIVSIFTGMNIMWLAIARYLGYFSGMDEDMKFNIYVAEFALASLTIFYSGQIFFKGAYYSLKNKIVNMDFLVITGAMITYLFSIWSGLFMRDEAYFDSSTMIITFVLVGKFLEVRSKKIGVDTLDTLMATIPTEAVVIKGKEKVVRPIDDVKKGDIIEIKPGEKVLFDATITSGETSMSSANITGESMPITCKEGDLILGGYENISSLIRASVTKPFKASTMYSIVSLLEESMNKKPQIEATTNNLSRWFSLIILSLAILTFAFWEQSSGLHRAIIVSVSVIVIACPCALALATPLASIVGISMSAKRGILFKQARHLETIAKAKILVVDKTGTITKGMPNVVRNNILKEFNKEVLVGMLSGSNHPVAKGLLGFFAQKSNLDLNITETPSQGLSCTYDGMQYYGGNEDFIRSKVGTFDAQIDDEYSHFIFANEQEVLAVFYLDDEIKEGAKEFVEKIHKMGIRLILATGDRQKNAEKIAHILGIKEFRADLKPIDKVNLVKDLHSQGTVISAGDGLNDAPMLGHSDIAIAMHTGADVSISVSDIVLLESSLKNLLDTFKISKRTYRLIKQNLFLSLIYNMLTIPIAMMGYVIPLVAALSMSLSSLIVVGNSLRIRSVS